MKASWKPELRMSRIKSLEHTIRINHSKKMPKIHWILQSNLIREHTFQAIRQSLLLDRISLEEVKIVPFSDELPEIETLGEITVFYGSTTLVLNAYKRFGGGKGIFYDPDTFSMKTYLEHWGAAMLNADSKILTFADIVALGLDADSSWFVRPVEDDKAFSGKVFSYAEICALEGELVHSNNPYLTTETLVAISAPKAITKEWRLFILEKQVISACRYTMHGSLSVDETDVPSEMIAFALKCCATFIPADVFVMDIALHDGAYKIVECNCFNDSGFYGHDIGRIIHAVNAFLATR
jgi:ATP-grasp domain, R2K clade family 3